MKCAICKGTPNPFKENLFVTFEGQDVFIKNHNI
jgi:hypothetical protein